MISEDANSMALAARIFQAVVDLSEFLLKHVKLSIFFFLENNLVVTI